MSNDKVFTDEELKEMGIPTLDLVKEAIDSGDKERAKELANRLKSEFNHLHDGYMVWVTGLLSYIYRNYGIDAVEEAEKEAHGIEGRTVFKPSGKTDLRSRVEEMAGALRGHMQPVVIKEDEEKITLTMKPCGSGERLIQMGGYEPEFGLLKVKDPHPATWGMKDFPLYCVHCPVMEMLSIENSGDIGVVHLVSEPKKMGECHFALYKNPDDIPEEYYKRIGRKKP
ncbi:hypothetical protein ACFL1N_10720 [Thermodesulfobacteriota bacterium]